MFFVAVRKDICILLTYISGNSFLSSTLTATTTIIIFLLLINREENHRKEKVKPCSFERSFYTKQGTFPTAYNDWCYSILKYTPFP